MNQYPILASIIGAVGALRLLIVPLMTAARIVVKATPSTEDDQKLDEFEKSPNYTRFLAILEWLTSIKVTR